VISPYFGSNSSITNYEPEIALCEKYGVPFFNFIDYPYIVEQSEYFQDLSHMNHKGAMAFTNMIVTEVLKNMELYSNSYHHNKTEIK
jgi:lysophospholipase L1-like esterase